VLLVLLSLAACDTNDNPADDLGVVAGEYTFTEFQFTPDLQLLTPVNLLDTLFVDQIRLQLFNSGRFTLLDQFRGGAPSFIGGDFTVNSSRVLITGVVAERSFYQALLLSNEITLDRGEDGTLNADIDRTVDLEAFSREYEGLPSVKGIMVLRLGKQL
jgi:hypothetical protein